MRFCGCCWACGYVGNALACVVHISTGLRASVDFGAAVQLGAGHNLPGFQGRQGADFQRPSLGSAPCPTPCWARMPGQYSTRCGSRPCPRLAEPAATARFFLCARCRAQVLICSRCDRGQIYCASGCAQQARRLAQQAAGRRYQASRRGRLSHAARAGRYRARQKNVTHQGSPPPPPDDLLSASSAVSTSEQPSAACSDLIAGRPGGRDRETQLCHWCGGRCLPFVRHDFLRRRAVARHRRGDHDHPT